MNIDINQNEQPVREDTESQDSNAWTKFYNSSIAQIAKKRKILKGTLMEEMRPVVTEKNEFEKGDHE